MDTDNSIPPPRIKIAHVIGHLKFGGAENQVLQLLNGLSPKRFVKHLILFENERTHYQSILSNTVFLKTLNIKRWGQLPCIFNLFRFFKRHRIEIVQSHMFHANLYTTIAAKLARVPITLTTEHGKNLWKTRIHHAIEKHIISPGATKRISVSKDINAIRVNSGDIPRQKAIIMPNCVQIVDAIKVPDSKPVFHIGTVGRLVEAKNYQNLIKAVAILVQKGILCNLTIVGDGPERKNLTRLTHQLKIADKVFFAGFQADIDSYLNCFNVFALSSIREGIPVSMLEAMAKQVPVISTSVGGIPEVIQHLETGYLIEDHSSDSFANGLEILYNNASLRQSIAVKGREEVAQRYSIESVSLAYERLYASLLANPN